MSVLNVTPDSFSDGGRFVDVEVAVDHALAQVAAGADIIDVGGESTRPGAQRISADEELGRVIPVVERLAAQGVVVSIDTMRSEVAAAAVAAGAHVVNDVSGGLADPAMHDWVARVEVPYVAMHWRGHSSDMERLATYDDVVAEVCAELSDRLDELAAAGVDPARVVIDPGLGFAKDAQHNWALLAGLAQLTALGHPVLVGASRKRFLGELLGEPGRPRPVGERDAATDAVTALAAAAGAWAVRVHDVRGSRDAIAVAGALAGSAVPGHARAGTELREARMTDLFSRDLDRISLTGVRARGFHGVFDEERRDGQEFRVDVVLGVLSISKAARTDDLGHTVDYGGVAAAVVEVVEGPPVNLIETLAVAIADRCLAFDYVRAVKVTVHKPQAPIPVPFDDVSVSITRAR